MTETELTKEKTEVVRGLLDLAKRSFESSDIAIMAKILEDKDGMDASVGLAVAKREGAYYDSEGTEITKEEYDLIESSQPFSRWIELRYEKGEYKGTGVDRYADDIRSMIDDNEMHEFLAALAHELMPL